MGQSGLGTIDLTVDQGAPTPIVVTRVFDDAGADGTTGFTEPFLTPADVPEGGGSGFLIGPADTSHFRYNIGIRTLDKTVSFIATVRNADGNVVQTVSRTYGPNLFVQTTSTAFLNGFVLGDNDSIQIVFAGGGLIVYGATVDNITNDPSAQFMSYATSIPVALNTETPRARLTSRLLLAVLVAVFGLGIGGVIARR
jgi:hypothetical protein